MVNAPNTSVSVSAVFPLLSIKVIGRNDIGAPVAATPVISALVVSGEPPLAPPPPPQEATKAISENITSVLTR